MSEYAGAAHGIPRTAAPVPMPHPTSREQTIRESPGLGESLLAAPPGSPRAPGPTLAAVLTGGDAISLAVGTSVAASVGGWRIGLLVGCLSALVLLVAPRSQWRFTLSVLDDLPLLAASVGSATMIVAAGVGLFDTTHDTTERTLAAVLAGVALVIALVVGRSATYAVALWLRRRGVGAARTLIVGGGNTGAALGRVLHDDDQNGIHLIGYVDDEPSPRDGRNLLGTLESLPNVVRDHHIDLVLIAFGAKSCRELVDPIRSIRPADCEVYVIPRLYELHDRAVATELVNGIPLVRLRRLAFRSVSWRVKRAMDVFAAVFGLILTSPVLLGVAIAVRIETGPGVIFRQQRVGRNGRSFTLYKFRSLKPIDGEDATRWSIDGDVRLGRVGNLIRTTSLDELPQLVNILRGDMSLVGPRPERPHFVDQFEQNVPGYRHRHRMPAGLTGLAAIHGLRGDTGIPERAHMDNIYAESWSLWLDIKIIFRTAAQLTTPGRQRRRHGGRANATDER